jgi:HK97 family phage prohead protease
VKYDFCGYATRNGITCADGRVIMRDAFKDNNGTKVPLVWQHLHDDPSNILGHAVLENRDDGVYAYASFNDSEEAAKAKELVRHGDITSMSIYANRLKQNGSNVMHGVIREVSLVIAGANPGAYIENVSFSHGDGTYDESDTDAIIHTGEDIKISEDEPEPKAEEVKPEEKPEEVEDEVKHADSEGEKMANGEKTVEDVYNEFTDEQKDVVNFLVGVALENAGGGSAEHGDYEGETFMKHNVFEDGYGEENTLSHDDLKAVFDDAPRVGSLKQSFLEHGIENIDYLFPEAHNITPTPEMITRQMDWVKDVWGATKKTPFARIKSTAANLTADAARAKGYIKGKKKLEEQLTLLRRTTTPQTVYKLQKLDRDDIIDITDLDVVAWLKAEMRMMLDEELARAILVGDGRTAEAEDKIKTDNIRPIYQDDDMYTIHYDVNYPADADDTKKSNILVDSAILARKDYKGSGSPVLYATNETINSMLLARDTLGHRLYKTMQELADALRVSKIVEVPVLEGVTREDADSKQHELLGLIVNLSDYTVGADKGGEVNLFDDFDIDYNRYTYLIETRCSGSLNKPYSAIALEVESTVAAG